MHLGLRGVAWLRYRKNAGRTELTHKSGVIPEHRPVTPWLGRAPDLRGPGQRRPADGGPSICNELSDQIVALALRRHSETLAHEVARVRLRRKAGLPSRITRRRGHLLWWAAATCSARRRVAAAHVRCRRTRRRGTTPRSTPSRASSSTLSTQRTSRRLRKRSPMVKRPFARSRHRNGLGATMHS